jgi:hypothetical protein
MEEESIWAFIEKDHQLLAPRRVDVIALYFLLFFGNMEQSLSDFILEEIGALRYEPYEIREEDLLFNERKVVDDFVTIYAWKTRLWEAMEENDVNSVIQLGEWFKEFEPHESMKRKMERRFNEIGSFLERLKEWDLAMEYFNQSQLPPARERRARILDKTGRTKASLRLAEEILSQPVDEVEEEFAVRFSVNLRKKLGLPFEIIEREQFPTDQLNLKRIPGRHIESIVLDHLLNMGKLGFHSENGIWTALFGLVFWDIVFMPLSGVFFNPFQRGPTDLFTDDFRKRREHVLEERITMLDERNEWEKMILARYDDKYNTANHLVPWKRISREQIEQILSWIPKKDILCILKRMSGKLKEFRSGFPDLVVYDPEEKRYVLMEVKGPGDQLRPNQKRWLRFFEENEIPYKVLRVKWVNG